MKNVFNFLFLVLILALNSCKEDEPITPTPVTPKCWEKFVGDYIVYDTANSLSYNMTITQFSTPNTNGGVEDTLVISNFANKFDFKYHFTCGSNPNLLGFNPPFPSYDHSNKRWSLTKVDDDSSTAKIENQLKNDTIILYFNLDNIAFYFPDGVPYYSANQKHIAVKQ